MRQNFENQLPLAPFWPSHQLSQELRVISKILDDNPEISHLVVQDLCDKVSAQMGAPGLSGEQIVRCGVLKQIHQFSYQRLAFHLEDSISARKFCRLRLGYTPSDSVLQENLSRVRASTWQQIKQELMRWAAQHRLEKGRKVRGDATTVKTLIHHPIDSELLFDGVQVLTQLLKACRLPLRFTDHRRRAKKRLIEIRNRRHQHRQRAYRDLLKVTHWVCAYVREALQNDALVMNRSHRSMVGKLRHYLSLVERVIDQTERRILHGETVPATEKIVSIFEEHTDIIRKGSHETIFGHKIYLTCAPSGLMVDCVVERGNPADSNWVQPLLERQQQLYGRYPRQASFDGAFASLDNLDWARKQGVRDVVFAKKCGLQIENMARSSWVYRQLRRFRAGIEGCISTLKRVFALRCCSWKGWPHFQQYVHLSVVSYNLIVLARLLLQ